MKNAIKKEIPRFKNEDEERVFWAEHDSSEYIDWSQSKTIALPKLKPTLKTISIRLPETMIDELKILANIKRCALSVFNESFPGGKSRARIL